VLGARAAQALDLARLGEAPIAIIVRASAASLRKIRGIYAGEVEQSFAGDYRVSGTRRCWRLRSVTSRTGAPRKYVKRPSYVAAICVSCFRQI
jgi:hypothetical protein